MLSRRLLRIKIVKALYSHFKAGEEAPARSGKELQTAIQKTYDLYLMLMALVVEVADVARERIEINQAKHMPTPEEQNPNLRFVNNAAIQKIAESPNLTQAMKEAKVNWKGYKGVIRRLYAELVESSYYKYYMAQQGTDFAADRKLIIDFLTHQIEDNEALEEALEEHSMFWVDDIGYALGLAIRTISLLNENSPQLAVMPMYKNDEDREYVQTLFRSAVEHHETYFAYIDQFTENWDFERIAFMDKLIMLAAIAELVEFETIPVKVTLDEYIEISKYYSTPGSGVFVNGILDKIVVKLTAEDIVRKTGRGLIDNTAEGKEQAQKTTVSSRKPKAPANTKQQ